MWYLSLCAAGIGDRMSSVDNSTLAGSEDAWANWAAEMSRPWMRMSVAGYGGRELARSMGQMLRGDQHCYNICMRRGWFFPNGRISHPASMRRETKKSRRPRTHFPCPHLRSKPPRLGFPPPAAPTGSADAAAIRAGLSGDNADRSVCRSDEASAFQNRFASPSFILPFIYKTARDAKQTRRIAVLMPLGKHPSQMSRDARAYHVCRRRALRFLPSSGPQAPSYTISIVVIRSRALYPPFTISKLSIISFSVHDHPATKAAAAKSDVNRQK